MKIFEGKLISVQMQNTAVVEVNRVKAHPLYRKLIRLSKKYKVDNTGFEDIEIGSFVKIQETKPMSKQKYFKIIEVVSKNETKKSKVNKKVAKPTSENENKTSSKKGAKGK